MLYFSIINNSNYARFANLRSYKVSALLSIILESTELHFAYLPRVWEVIILFAMLDASDR